MLLVCGTGMATSIHGQFVLCGMAENLDVDDPILHPLDCTERGQIQYRIAGKGIWGVMRRAIGLSEVPSAHSCFSGPQDSRRVFELAVLADSDPPPLWIDATQSELQILRKIARQVVDRGVSTLAHCIHTTHQHAAKLPASHRDVYLTGSIAENPWVYERLLQYVERAGWSSKFALRIISLPQKKVYPALDLAVLGAAAAGFALQK
jgi:hypothetical protein